MKPKTYWDSDLDDEIIPMTITVHEEDETHEDTGLLDQHGNPLVRVREKRKIGFKT